MNYNKLLQKLTLSAKKEKEAYKYILGQIIQEVGSHIINYDEKDKRFTVEFKDIQDHFDADYYLFTYKNKTYDLYSYNEKERKTRKKGIEKANLLYNNTVESFSLENYKKRLNEFIQLGEYFKKLGFNIELIYDKDIENHSLENRPSRWWISVKINL